MPRVKLGVAFTDIRGKQGGSVWATNQGGLYYRNNHNTGQRQTLSQNQRRISLASVSGLWRKLTSDQRNAWIAAAPDFPTTNIFGDPRIPTGYELFMRINMELKTLRQSLRNTPPTPTSIPVIGAIVWQNMVPSNQGLEFSEASAADSLYKIFVTRPMSPGIQKIPVRWYLIKVSATGGLNRINFSTEYQAKFGVPVVGSQIFAKVVFVWDLLGIAGPPMYVQGIVS